MVSLPIIKIFEYKFFFDEKLKQLRACNNPYVNINLTQTDTDSISYLINNKIKVNWNVVLSDYKKALKKL